MFSEREVESLTMDMELIQEVAAKLVRGLDETFKGMSSTGPRIQFGQIARPLALAELIESTSARALAHMQKGASHV